MTGQVRAWVERIVGEYRPCAPVLEVGAHNINGTVRDLFPVPYTGLDAEAGEGVDVVGDVLTHHFGEEFATIVSVETLEHVTEPWTALARMGRWLRPGGHLIIAAPFMHGLCNHPRDYWRFTDQAIAYLFGYAGLKTLIAEMDEAHAYGVATK